MFLKAFYDNILSPGLHIWGNERKGWGSGKWTACSALERTASITWELQTAIDQDQRRAPLCATWSLFPFISAPPCFSLTPCFQKNLSPASQSISHHSVMSSQKAQVGHICTLSLCLLLNVVYLFFKKLEFILPVKPSQSWSKNDFSPLPVDDLRTLQQLLLFSRVYVQWFGDHILTLWHISL